VVLVAAVSDLALFLVEIQGGATFQIAADGYLTYFCTLFFPIDVAARIYVFQELFFSKMWHVFDLVVTVLAVGLLSMSSWMYHLDGLLVSSLRCTRVVWIAVRARRGSHYLRTLFSGTRRITGRAKRRYVSLTEDFDLDLSHITERVIAMSVPASKWTQALYRNPMSEVIRFFESKHRHGYMIVNACPELPYDCDLFETGKVVQFDVQDHTPPSMRQFIEFLNVTKSFMDSDRDNVLAVHCRGGKGRTGSFVAAYLILSGEFERSEDALDLFAVCRTDFTFGAHKLQGVETPSQVRYVKYLETHLRQHGLLGSKKHQPDVVAVELKPIQLLTMTMEGLWLDNGRPRGEVAIAIHSGEITESRVVFWSSPFNPGSKQTVQVDMCETLLQGEARVSLFLWSEVERARAVNCGPAFPGDTHEPQEPSGLLHRVLTPLKRLDSSNSNGGEAKPVVKRCRAGAEPGCLMYFLFHTSFLDHDLRQWSLGASEIDKACKRVGKSYARSGKVTLTFKV